MSRLQRTSQIKAALARWTPELQNERLERQILEEIIRHSYMGCIAPLTIISQELLGRSTSPQVECKCACGRVFNTQQALNGHRRSCKKQS
jgi:hypothetical protein